MRREPRYSSLLAVAAGTLLAGFTAAHAQTQDAPARAPLFDSGEVLNLTLAGDLKTLFDDRDSVKAKYHPARITYTGPGGASITQDVKLKTRGHWRRQKKNCGDIPPIRVDFPKKQGEGSVFEGQNKLKLVTFCRKSDEFDQYVLREYLVYQVYNLLTPLSLKARLARVTYADTTGKLDSLTRHSFFIEDEEAMAERNAATLLDVTGARFGDVDSDQMGLVSAFFYMIGATDWSLVGLHNVFLVQGRETGIVYPVAYDFDWTGLVWTRYSFPDYRLPIKSVRERIYRGDCRTQEQWQPILARFIEKKEAIYDVYRNAVGLDPAYVKQATEYLDQFYRVITNPRQISGELIGPCQKN